ncbi:type II secretion system F family protein [Patescibacteria group bacterium]|nr:type II secretion system F family protein [Patescibacteria group bacterium]
MPEFSYKARDQSGEVVSGVVVAPSENIAYGMLRDKRLFIVSLKERKKRNFLGKFSLGTGVTTKDIVIFSRQLSVMITSSVPIVKALKVLVRQTDNVRLKTILSDVADEVDGGAKLSQALGKYPRVFGNFFIQMVRSAETTGRLDEILDYLANQEEKDYDMKSKTRGALIYPAFIFSSLVMVGALMMMFVLPQITSIFEDTDVELPITTIIFIGMSDILIGYWWLIILILVGIAFGIRAIIKTEIGRRKFDILKIRAPLVGKLFNMLYLARLSRSLSTLLSSGVPLTKSLDIVADVVGNTMYRDLTRATIKKVEGGGSITTEFLKSKYVPLMLSQMMSVGEQSGQLDKILIKVADFYQRELENHLANFSTAIEPLIMIILGVSVGFLVSAIILPLYNLTSAI